MEIDIAIEGEFPSLTRKQEDFCVKKIVALFDKFQENRSRQLEDIRTIKSEIYAKNQLPQSSWNAQVNLPDLYELAQTLKSHLIENLYSHPEAMFDVTGSTAEAQHLANAQKSMLVSAFEKMDFGIEFEKLINCIVEAGEASVFVGWQTKVKEIRRKNDSTTGKNSSYPYVIENKPVYDGPCVKYIAPEDFVFDTEIKDRWDNCAKIYRTYQDIEQIASNPANNKFSTLKKSMLEIVATDKKSGKGVKGGRLEVLEFWGNLALNNGTIIKNCLITVAGRSEIIRFEPNPFIINPFIYGNIIEDPETGRGISPLKIAVGLNRLSSTILNKQLDALSLMINPPYLAPKGCFKGEQNVKPGKIIEYDAALMPAQPIALKFDSALRGWDFIQHFKASIESATGIFRNMSGNISPEARTATEMTYTMNGQAVRLSMIIDSINRKFIIPIVEKTADIISNFKFGEESIAVRTPQGINFIKINDNVRSNDYIYRYGDRKATLERKYRFKEIFDVIGTFAKIPELTNQIDWLECFKFALEQYGVENSENFLKKFDSMASTAANKAAAEQIQSPKKSAVSASQL